MGKVFSRYLSTGSDSVVLSNLTRSPSFVAIERASDGNRSDINGGAETLPHKGDALGASPSAAPSQLGGTQGADAAGIPATKQEPDAARKDSCAQPVKYVPSNDASLKHLTDSDQRVPLPSSGFRQSPAASGQLFGAPLRSGAGGGGVADQLQLSTTEAVSLSSTVPLRHYSETKASNLAARLRPVYKREKIARPTRMRWPSYAVCVALVGLTVSVLVLVVIITAMWRRPGLKTQTAGLVASAPTISTEARRPRVDAGVLSVQKTRPSGGVTGFVVSPSPRTGSARPSRLID
ncbi:uncharacterized protein [Dermacentor albipictus]|uniref:uncharacterized protein isoform X2 n=1 Tax=Dermacentor albipictus TaxID=60249 RepID=UPI0031FBFD22